jgi:hypothetical protein
MLMPKAQVGMQFMMSYGWAIIIVFISLGALTYLNVLSPQKLLPEKTIFENPVPNIDDAVVSLTGRTISIPFKNNKGYPISIPKTTTIDSKQCLNGIIINVTDPKNNELTPTSKIENGETFIITWKCDAIPETKQGNLMTANIAFDFQNLYTGQVIRQSGTVDGKWK